MSGPYISKITAEGVDYKLKDIDTLAELDNRPSRLCYAALSASLWSENDDGLFTLSVNQVFDTDDNNYQLVLFTADTCIVFAGWIFSDITDSQSELIEFSKLCKIETNNNSISFTASSQPSNDIKIYFYIANNDLS